MKMYLGKKGTSATSRSKKAPRTEMKLLNSSKKLKLIKSAPKEESSAGKKVSLRTSQPPKLHLLKKVRVRNGKLSESKKLMAAREAKPRNRSRSFEGEGQRADDSDAKSKKVKKEKRLRAMVEDEKGRRKEDRNSLSQSAKKWSKREASKLEGGVEASGIGTKSRNRDGKTEKASGLGEKSKNAVADEEAPKKRRKRVIRIDPYDISNKRLDDRLSAPIGRSNVGKSSLLNALTRQWGVVRTSDKPGLTQTINFFKLGPKLCLVDLPGYGFAYAKEGVKDAWEKLVKEYVSTRVGLRRVCLLIDTKWGMKPRDCELINLMERSQTQYQIVLTKTDTVFPIDVARRAMQIQEGLRGNKSIVQPVMMVSSKSGAGIRCLRAVLSKIARVAKI